MSAVTELAEMVCVSSPIAVQAAKRLYNLALKRPLAMGELGRQFDMACRESENDAEGPRTFAEKRRPVRKNR